MRRAGVTKGALYHHFADKAALFEAVLAEAIQQLGVRAQALSRERMARQGRERRGAERIMAAADIYLEQLCQPEVRQLVLQDGPSALGRERWHRLWVENSLQPVRRILGSHDGLVGIAPEHTEPLAHVILGGVQEAALAIAERDDPEAARREFARSMVWMLGALHRQAEEDARSAPRR